MIRLLIICSIILTAGIFATGCKTTPSCLTVTPPDIHLTGERTAIEKQIVGEYSELEKNAWVVSSVKTSIHRSEPVQSASGGDPEILKAMRVRDYQTELIRSYKDRGILGESYKGYIMQRKRPEKATPAERERIQSLIKSENRARKTIFSHALGQALERKPTPEELEEYGRLFGREQLTRASEGDWFYTEEGRWLQKNRELR
jgi:uncharacterized protein YdbL (DUF1318 family)